MSKPLDENEVDATKVEEQVMENPKTNEELEDVGSAVSL